MILTMSAIIQQILNDKNKIDMLQNAANIPAHPLS